MKLLSGSFNAIQSGIKKIESRLFDEKRKQIRLGDLITFRNKDIESQTITVKVVGLLRYPTFSLLFSDFQPAMFGGDSVQSLEDQLYSFYSKDDEVKYGVLGIRVVLDF